MPCYVTGTAEGDARLAAEEARDKAKWATRAACDALRIVEELGAMDRVMFSTHEWWKEHKQADASPVYSRED